MKIAGFLIMCAIGDIIFESNEIVGDISIRISGNEIVRVIAPEGPRVLHIEMHAFMEDQEGISPVVLHIAEFDVSSDITPFLDCFKGPLSGCKSEMNTLPACWIKAENGAWVEELHCTDFTRFEQFSSYLGLTEDAEVPDFAIWTCRGITPVEFVACQAYDYDFDGDIDLVDFAQYQRQYRRPG